MRTDYVRHASGRMFDHPFLEACSKIHPIVPLAFYGPLVTGLLGWALWSEVSDGPRVVSWGAVGVAIWTVLEYVLHRFVFHHQGRTAFAKRFHAIIHGYHHRFPDDGYRLVMPLGASIPMALVVAGALWPLGEPGATVPVFCGIVSGYLFYDYLHFSVHALPPRTRWGRAIRAHHLSHHFADPTTNFGLTQRFVDRMAGTLRRRPPLQLVRRAD